MREFLSAELLDKYINEGKLTLYIEEAERANAKFSLFARNLKRNDLRLLIADCLIPIELGWISAESGRILDIGSGWGLPAIPLLLAQNDLAITMVERSEKKSGFLSLMLNRLQLEANIHAGELKQLPDDFVSDTVISRRLALDEKIIKEIKRYAHEKTLLIYFGPEFPKSRFQSFQAVEYKIDNGPMRTVVRVEKI